MALARIFPFAVFMGFIGVEELLRMAIDQGLISQGGSFLPYLYPVKALVTAGVVVFFRKRYDELRPADLGRVDHTLASIVVGLIVFALWVNMDWPFATFGDPKGLDPSVFEDTRLRSWMIAFRLFGAVLVVPVMEELFWRSFLLRYVIGNDFTKVPIGAFSWTSFLVTVVLFGLEHNYYLAGMMAGAAFNLLLYYTRSIAQCVLCHAVANLALGVYVLQTGQWRFW
ncbi:CAAX prenyl protease-related protein [Desulfuromonas versatilis]|uniref:CAAX prenyl protease-related protein n=1 Tax=Desulfuromonas versatilis TaxID=2802975 RepID=A0ABN6DZ99_9BACT|nr:CAAX prenyl protease-related protein [Desulfuromonas versatilis]BCR05301.1 CAAX prenyl protease-related protein [Desulfuromonas versatilis]